MKDLASSVFRRPPERLNCAQAVLHAHSKASGVELMPVSDLKPLGGGRAPGGLCGALYAACIIAPQKAEVLMSRFTQELGSAKRKVLRTNKEHCCERSVATAAGLLEDEMTNRESVPSDHKG